MPVDIPIVIPNDSLMSSRDLSPRDESSPDESSPDSTSPDADSPDAASSGAHDAVPSPETPDTSLPFDGRDRNDVDPERAMRQLMEAGGRPPHRENPFQIAGRTLAPSRVIELLDPFMTDRRLRRIRSVVARRTRTVLPVVEGLVNTGNVSAVMRSAEAMGYQDVHVVKGSNETRYKHSKRTTQGAQHWLDVWRWPDAEAFTRAMHASGYRVVVTALREDARSIRELDFTQPTALVVGNELEGASDAMLEHADEAVVIPLDGFTESFNVSVAASIGLYHAREDRIRRRGEHADLSPDEQEALVARFCLRSVTNAEAIIERVLA